MNEDALVKVVGPPAPHYAMILALGPSLGPVAAAEARRRGVCLADVVLAWAMAGAECARLHSPKAAKPRRRATQGA